MLNTRILLRGVAAAAGALILAFAASSFAADILDDWATVKLPPAPELKPVTLEGSTTALLILDMMKANCGTRAASQRFPTSSGCTMRRALREQWCGTALSAATAWPPLRI